MPLFLPKDVLSGMQSLRQLELANCCFANWDSHPLLPNPLTHLKLHKHHRVPTGKILMDLLSRMPALQVLDIKHSPSWESRTKQGIQFMGTAKPAPRPLHTLRIEASFSSAVDFFQLITFPDTAVVCVIFRKVPHD